VELNKVVTLLRYLDGDMIKLVIWTIGYVLTHGTQVGEKMDSSESKITNVESVIKSMHVMLLKILVKNLFEMI